MKNWDGIVKAYHDAGERLRNTQLITEVMDSTNQNLVSRAGVRDFIISNWFVSMILAQLSEEVDIKQVYDDLFSEDGFEIYLEPFNIHRIRQLTSQLLIDPVDDEERQEKRDPKEKDARKFLRRRG